MLLVCLSGHCRQGLSTAPATLLLDCCSCCSLFRACCPGPCCMQLQRQTCADLSGSCPAGYASKPGSTVISTLPVSYTADCCSEIPATCSSTDPTKTPAIPYDCSQVTPGYWMYDSSKADQSPSAGNCCKVSGALRLLPYQLRSACSTVRADALC
jgi:hypothetical protein